MGVPYLGPTIRGVDQAARILGRDINFRDRGRVDTPPDLLGGSRFTDAILAGDAQRKRTIIGPRGLAAQRGNPFNGPNPLQQANP